MRGSPAHEEGLGDSRVTNEIFRSCNIGRGLQKREMMDDYLLGDGFFSTVTPCRS